MLHVSHLCVVLDENLLEILILTFNNVTNNILNKKELNETLCMIFNVFCDKGKIKYLIIFGDLLVQVNLAKIKQNPSTFSGHTVYTKCIEQT